MKQDNSIVNKWCTFFDKIGVKYKTLAPDPLYKVYPSLYIKDNDYYLYALDEYPEDDVLADILKFAANDNEVVVAYPDMSFSIVEYWNQNVLYEDEEKEYFKSLPNGLHYGGIVVADLNVFYKSEGDTIYVLTEPESCFFFVCKECGALNFCSSYAIWDCMACGAYDKEHHMKFAVKAEECCSYVAPQGDLTPRDEFIKALIEAKNMEV